MWSVYSFNSWVKKIFRKAGSEKEKGEEERSLGGTAPAPWLYFCTHTHTFRTSFSHATPD